MGIAEKMLRKLHFLIPVVFSIFAPGFLTNEKLHLCDLGNPISRLGHDCLPIFSANSSVARRLCSISDNSFKEGICKTIAKQKSQPYKYFKADEQYMEGCCYVMSCSSDISCFQYDLCRNSNGCKCVNGKCLILDGAVWGSWSSWSSCFSWIRKRGRMRPCYKPLNSEDVVSASSCPGSYFDEESCTGKPCYDGIVRRDDGWTGTCSDGCNRCSCRNGRLTSTRMLCPKKCSDHLNERQCKQVKHCKWKPTNYGSSLVGGSCKTMLEEMLGSPFCFFNVKCPDVYSANCICCKFRRYAKKCRKSGKNSCQDICIAK